MNSAAIERPCDVIRRYLEASGQTQGWLAMRLGVSPPYVCRMLQGDIGISPAMAHRLAKALGESARFWGRLQVDYDVDRLSEAGDGEVITP